MRLFYMSKELGFTTLAHSDLRWHMAGNVHRNRRERAKKLRERKCIWGLFHGRFRVPGEKDGGPRGGFCAVCYICTDTHIFSRNFSDFCRTRRACYGDSSRLSVRYGLSALLCGESEEPHPLVEEQNPDGSIPVVFCELMPICEGLVANNNRFLTVNRTQRIQKTFIIFLKRFEGMCSSFA